jgi:N-acetylmuramoyl-L-alanine amidase
MSRRSTNYIVIHCSATRALHDIGAKEIRSWHKAKGWRDIGYHFVIRRYGAVEKGRGVDEIGSHVQGYNAASVGICMVGGLNNDTYAPEANYTPAQWAALKLIVRQMVAKYPKAKVLGHRDFPKVAKACPCFDAKPWAAKNGFPV